MIQEIDKKCIQKYNQDIRVKHDKKIVNRTLNQENKRIREDSQSI